MPTRSGVGILCLGVLLCCLVGLVAGSIVLSEATLHVPRSKGDVPASVRAQASGAVWLDVAIHADDGAKLRAWLVRPLHSNGNCVAVLHGIGDSRPGSVGFARRVPSERYTRLR